MQGRSHQSTVGRRQAEVDPSRPGPTRPGDRLSPGPVDGHPKEARLGYPPKVARADQHRLAVELVGNDLRVFLPHGGVFGEGAEPAPRQAPLDVVDEPGRLEKEAAPLCPGPSDRMRLKSWQGGAMVTMIIATPSGSACSMMPARVLGQVATLPEPGQGLLDRPSPRAVDLPSDFPKRWSRM